MLSTAQVLTALLRKEGPLQQKRPCYQDTAPHTLIGVTVLIIKGRQLNLGEIIHSNKGTAFLFFSWVKQRPQIHITHYSSV